VEREAALPAALRPIHRGVRVLDERLGIVSIVGEKTDPDTGCQPEYVLADASGASQRGD